MKTDAQILEKIAYLESLLGPRKESRAGRCPIRLRINNLRWILKTRTLLPKEEVSARASERFTRIWATSPIQQAKKQLAADKRLLAEVIQSIRKELIKKRKVVSAARAKERSRTSSLAAYYKKRQTYNAARAKPLDHWFRKAIARGAQETTARRGDFFRVIARLDKKLRNRAYKQLVRSLRRRLQKVFHQNIDASKTARELLGCEIPFLRNHLESLWKPGMTWANYGFYGWHIDHIKPCAKFDLNDPEQRKQCFHWSNLQPLWAAENFAKHNH